VLDHVLVWPGTISRNDRSTWANLAKPLHKPGVIIQRLIHFGVPGTNRESFRGGVSGH
jgi:hypothetical protein